MSKHKRRREIATASAVAQAGAGETAAASSVPDKTGWRRLPIWVWALIFIMPLVGSELMFYVSGRTANMVLFPLAWVGFWVAIAFRLRILPRQ
ncbi:MAG TPA: hypothetical protein VGA61_11455 [Anaerolineae bacterium]